MSMYQININSYIKHKHRQVMNTFVIHTNIDQCTVDCILQHLHTYIHILINKCTTYKFTF